MSKESQLLLEKLSETIKKALDVGILGCDIHTLVDQAVKKMPCKYPNLERRPYWITSIIRSENV